jgi:hypothetical protein
MADNFHAAADRHRTLRRTFSHHGVGALARDRHRYRLCVLHFHVSFIILGPEADLDFPRD